MKIALISSTVLPACEPNDPYHTSFYGSETMNCTLVRGLAEAGHFVSFYAPRGSTTFYGHPRIEFHPIVDSKGAHLADERLETISYDGSKTTDLLDFDFIIDCSKQCHVTEELSLWHDYQHFANWRSGYRDWQYPLRISGHFVTHCRYFKRFFEENGHQAEVARFGLSSFWNPGDSDEDMTDMNFTASTSLYDGENFHRFLLFPHRPLPEKGIDTVLKLARHFNNHRFVISTGAIFEDHIREMARIRDVVKEIPNVSVIDCPKTRKYHYYRRALMRNASAVLSLFDNRGGYLDTGGLVSAEAVRCGTPVIVTRSPGSEELFGSLEDKGVTFVDGYDGARLAIQGKFYEERPNVDSSWMSVDSYVSDWERIIKKYV